MRQRLNLKLNGKHVAVSDGATVAMSYQVYDLHNIESRNGGKSNEFDLPIEPNREALESLHDHQSGSLLPYRLIPATLESNGVDIPCGPAEITESGDTVKVVLRPGNSDLWSRIKGKKISDLDLTQYDGAMYYMQGGYNYLDEGFCFLIQETGRTVRRDRTAVDMLGEELVLHIFSKYLLEQIVTQAGFTPVGSLFDLPKFKDEVIPQSEAIKLRQSYVDGFYALAEQTVAVQIPVHFPTGQYHNEIPFWTEVADPGGYYNPGTSEYTTSAQPGDYEVEVNLVYDWTKTTSYPKISIYENNTERAQVNLSAEGTFQTTNLKATIRAASSAIIRVEIAYQNSDDIIIRQGSRFEIRRTTRAYNHPTTPLHLDANLPNLTQLDLLKDIVNRYNVVIDTRETEVEFKLFNDLAAETAEDWSDKVDMLTTPVLSYRLNDYAQVNTFAYSDDKAGLYSASITINNSALPLERTVYTSPFAITEQVQAFNRTTLLYEVPLVEYDSSLKLFVLDSLIQKDQYVYDNGRYYKCLFTNYTPQAPDYSDEAGIHVPGTGMACERIGDPGKYSATSYRVHYREERPDPIRVATDTGRNTGFNTYWQGVSEEMDWPALIGTYYQPLTYLLQNVQVVNCRMRLSAVDIQALPFLRPVYIAPVTIKGRTYFGGTYYLNLVDEFLPGTDHSTDVTLIRLN